MYSHSILNVIPTFRRISFSLVTCGDPGRQFAVVINLTGLQCEINEVSHRAPCAYIQKRHFLVRTDFITTRFQPIAGPN